MPALIIFGSLFLIILGESAFAACGKLTEVRIPRHIRAIGNHAFAYCERPVAFGLRPGAFALFALKKSKHRLHFRKSCAIMASIQRTIHFRKEHLL